MNRTNYFSVTNINYYLLILCLIAYALTPLFRFNVLGKPLSPVIFCGALLCLSSFAILIGKNFILHRNFYLEGIFYLFVLFLIWSTASLLWSENLNSLLSFKIYFYFLLILSLLAASTFPEYQLINIGKMAVYIVIMFVVIGFWQMITTGYYFNLALAENGADRVSGTKNLDSFMLIALLPYTFARFLINKGLKKVTFFILIFLSLVGVLLSGSRGMSIWGGLVVVSTLFYANTFLKIKGTLSAIVLILFGIIMGYISVQIYFGELYELVLDRFFTIKDDSRFELANHSFITFKENILHGVGFNSYEHPFLRSTNGHAINAHNTFLNLAAELGLIGVTIFTLILVYPIVVILILTQKIKAFKKEDKILLLESFGLATLLFISSVTHTFYSFIIFWFLYLLNAINICYLVRKFNLKLVFK